MDSIAFAENKKIVVYLVRHAESLCNERMGRDEDEHQDAATTDLTPLGKQQAARLGEHLAPINFDYAYASDYKRAVETAKIVLNHQTTNNSVQPQIEICKELREMDLGKLTQSWYPEVLSHYMKCNQPLQNWVLPEGESTHDTGKRMLHLFDTLCANLLESNDEATLIKPETNVLIVSHTMAIVAFLNFLTHDKAHPHSMLNWNGDADVKIIKNCCYYKFEVCKSTGSSEKTTPASVLPLEINVVEKFVKGHLSQKSDDEDVLNVSSWQKNSVGWNFNRVREVLEGSERGREVMNCVQQ